MDFESFSNGPGINIFVATELCDDDNNNKNTKYTKTGDQSSLED